MNSNRFNSIGMKSKFILLTVIILSSLFNKVVAKKISTEVVETITSPTATVVLDVKDPEYDRMTPGYASWSPIFDQESVSNIVQIKMDYSDAALMDEHLVYTAKVVIVYDVWDQTSDAFVPNTKTETITIDANLVDPTASVNDNVFIHIKGGGNNMKVTITPTSVSSKGSFPPVLKVKAEIIAERYYHQITSAPEIGDADFVTTDKTISNGLYQVSWPELEYAEWYDFEWTFVNDYDDIGGDFLSPSSIQLQENFFRHNSTRVSLENPSYEIPMLYESGYLIHRVRAVGMTREGKMIQGKWSVSENKASLAKIVSDYPNQIYKFIGLQNDMSWQAATKYVEGGKNKSTVNFFDGSLRNRQAVVKNNSDDVVLVGETVYDHQGRPAVNILPAPNQNSNKLDFFKEYNLSDATNKPFDKLDFDVDKNGDACNPKVTGLSTVSGASNYYSADNPDKTGHNAYIPNAQKFPFTQIQYTNDNRGIVKKQSGVGLSHNMASDHTTQYFYESADQQDLYRLFGYEVGNAAHYKKQTVINENGQGGVTYYDPQGHVIASSFRGNSPTDANGNPIVDPLPYQEKENIPMNLLTKGTNIPVTNEKVGYSEVDVQKTFLQNDLNREIDYNVDVPKYLHQQECADGTVEETCYNCVLDLELSVTNHCGDEFASVNGSPFKLQIDNGTNCDNTNFSKKISLTKETYKQGSYNINKELTVNEEKLQEHLEKFLSDANNCIKPYQTFLDEQTALFDPNSCDLECETCIEDLNAEYGNEFGLLLTNDNGVDEYQDNFPHIPIPGGVELEKQAKYAEYLTKLDACESQCQENKRCVAFYASMVQDMGPNGQYGKVQHGGPGSGETYVEDGEIITAFDVDAEFDDDYTPEDFPLSIYNYNNDLPRIDGKTPSWRRPITPLREANNEISYIVLEKTGLTTYDPPVYDISHVIEDPDGYFKIQPNLLLYVDDFISEYRESWAKSYVGYHPEFPFYEECKKISKSYDFDQKIAKAKVADVEGVDSKYNALNGGKTNLNVDPFFNGRTKLDNLSIFSLSTSIKYGNQFKLQMDNYASSGYPMWELAHGMVNCVEMGTTCAGSCPNGEIVDTDDEWNRYTGLYVSAKENLIDNFYYERSTRNGFYNGCIGNKSFNPHDYLVTSTSTGLLDFLDGFFGFRFGFFREKRLCNIKNYELYQGKTPRFPLKDNIGLSDASRSEYCYNETENGDIKPFNCPEKMLEQGREVNKLHYLRIYKDCGQCPMAFDLESFLNGIATSNNYDVGTDIPLTCASTTKPFLSEIMKTGLGFTTTHTINYQFLNQTTNSFNAEQINAQFINYDNPGTGAVEETRSINLAFNDKFLDGNDIINFQASNIESFCCLSFLSNTTLLENPIASNTFSFNVIYNDNGVSRKIYGEGQTQTLNLASCSFDKVCTTNQTGYHLQNLLNLLSFNFGSGYEHGLTTTAQLENAPYEGSVTDNLRNNVINSDKWQWSSSISGNVLTGQINVDDVGIVDQFSIKLTKDINDDFDFTSIEKFSAIRDNDKDISLDPAKNLLINVLALNKSTGAKEYFTVQLKIEGKDLELQSCSEPIIVEKI